MRLLLTTRLYHKRGKRGKRGKGKKLADCLTRGVRAVKWITALSAVARDGGRDAQTAPAPAPATAAAPAAVPAAVLAPVPVVPVPVAGPVVAPADAVAAKLAEPPAGYEHVFRGWALLWTAHGRGAPCPELRQAVATFVRYALGDPPADLRPVAEANANVADCEGTVADCEGRVADCKRRVADCDNDISRIRRGVADLERRLEDPERTTVRLDATYARLDQERGDLRQTRNRLYQARDDLRQAMAAATLARAAAQVDELLEGIAAAGGVPARGWKMLMDPLLPIQIGSKASANTLVKTTLVCPLGRGHSTPRCNAARELHPEWLHCGWPPLATSCLIGEQLGSGRSGVVCRGTFNRQPAALKCCPAGYMVPTNVHPTVLARELTGEVVAYANLQSLRGSAVPRLFGHGLVLVRGVPYAVLALELVKDQICPADGERRRSAIRRQCSLPAREGVVEALRAVHRLGACHCDARGHNVLFEEDPECPGELRGRLIDFSLGKVDPTDADKARDLARWLEVLSLDDALV